MPVFFIFVVSNIGGLLTPLGDPPLFLGFLKGVDFFWTLRLWPQWLLVNGLVLAVFFVWDSVAYRRETAGDVREDEVRVAPAAGRAGWPSTLRSWPWCWLAVLFQSPQVGRGPAALGLGDLTPVPAVGRAGRWSRPPGCRCG